MQRVGLGAEEEASSVGSGSRQGTAPAVELRSISRRFAGRTILDDVSLAIEEGEFFALVGPSGSGKSTLLKMVSGIDRPDVGEVWLRGANVTSVPAYRRDVHTVFQNYALFPHLDVEANVAFPLRVAGVGRAERRQRAARALSWVRLEQFTKRHIDKLSGGERQRVAVARALVDEPACVLLDEPLAALDPHLRSSTLELLEEIQARLGVTYIYVTHDRQEALRAADRIAVLHEGRLEQVGAPTELYRQPASAFVASFLGPINWFHGEIEAAKRDSVFLASGAVLPVDSGNGLFHGRVLIGIRPEHVLIGGQEFLTAEVVHRDFCGSSVTLKMKTPCGTSITAELRSESELPGVGSRVPLSWRPEAVHVFPEEHGASRRE